MIFRVVIDTNIFVSACLSGGSAHQVVRACLDGRCKPLMGAALLTEYEDLLGQGELLRTSPLSATERTDLLDIFLGCCEWTRVYFGWHPNLPDEADNHLIELAVAGAAPFIVTRNLRDFARADLRFPGLSVVNPQTFLKEIETWQP